MKHFTVIYKIIFKTCRLILSYLYVFYHFFQLILYNFTVYYTYNTVI